MNTFKRSILGVALIACTMAAVTPVCKAQPSYGLPGSQKLSIVPTILEGFGGGVTNFVIGTTNATVSPIALDNCRTITWEMTGQATNTTSTVSAVFALFCDTTATNWYTVATNAAVGSIRTLTFLASTGLRTESTNFDIGAYRYMIPLYITNSGQCVSNLSLRYGLKPGF
jgi:hypothetical protein